MYDKSLIFGYKFFEEDFLSGFYFLLYKIKIGINFDDMCYIIIERFFLFEIFLFIFLLY